MMRWLSRRVRPQGVRVATTHGREVPCRVRRLRGRHWAARPLEQLRAGELVRQVRYESLPPRSRLSLLLGMSDIDE